MCANDTKFYRNISSTTDSECLQESLSNLNRWSLENNIKFNASKCKILSVTRKKNPDLITFRSKGKKSRLNCDLQPQGNTNIQMVTSKANEMPCLLKRTCSLLTKDKIRRSISLSIGKPQLFYGTEIWSPSNVHLKIKIEVV